jgi:hypothetical protein
MRVVVGSLQGLEAPEIPWLGVGGESFPWNSSMTLWDLPKWPLTPLWCYGW